MPKDPNIRKVLIIGSGPIVIGQAAEFDYSGTQGCRTCRKEGVETILVNSNPATIQTDPEVADRVYIEPLTVDSLERIIAREQPDGIIANIGGQTGLNLATAIQKAGLLEKYGVRILGTSAESIRRGEDREEFANVLHEIGEPALPSRAVTDVQSALDFAGIIGYPVIVRAAFTLGGTGSGMAFTPDELRSQVADGLRSSLVGQVLIEKSVLGWGEFEYEVVRDKADNCIVVCTMENMDPMGVHTGESIVVAPQQTLSDDDHQKLRSAAIKVVRALGVEGGCNIQFAVDYQSGDYYVIEVNPRLSRSSALASKATGYPIAKVATRIALGYTLDEIRNDITGTSAAFEPTLDYVVVKIPRWPFDKFPGINRRIGVSMKSTGETMAIGRTFEEAMQKAVRSLDLKTMWLSPDPEYWTRERLVDTLEHPSDERLFAIYNALAQGMSIDEIHKHSNINRWFLAKVENIWKMEQQIVAEAQASASSSFPLSDRTLRRTKRMGFGDRQLARLIARGSGKPVSGMDVRAHRLALNAAYKAADGMSDSVLPGTKAVFKVVDTCAGEFAALTPYYYSTYEQENEATYLPGPKVIILGSGPIRIGQGIEFDYSTVHAVTALREQGIHSIIINNNPETVSTDYDISDRLYFEPLTLEEVLNVIDNEQDGLLGVIPQFGGQTAINLVHPLEAAGVQLLGTSAEAIDIAEDRAKSSAVITELGMPIPPWGAARTWGEARQMATSIGYPVLIRPSYVLGGRGMRLVYGPDDLNAYLAELFPGRSIDEIDAVVPEHPVLIDKFLQEAVEVDVDAVSDGQDVFSVVMEQIEEAGIHSGDSACVYPPQTLSPELIQGLEEYTRALAQRLNIIGLMNVQYAVKDNRIYVLEVNPRASRTVPFASKATGVPLANIATRVILGQKLANMELKPQHDLVSVKETVLPFKKLPGLDPVLKPEMQSTGEAMGIDKDFARAFYKAELGAGIKRLPVSGKIYISLGLREGQDSLEAAAQKASPATLKRLAASLAQTEFTIYAPVPTAKLLRSLGVEAIDVPRVTGESPNAIEMIKPGAEVRGMTGAEGLVLLVSVPQTNPTQETAAEEFALRRKALEFDLPYITTIAGLEAFLKAVAAVREAGNEAIQPVLMKMKKIQHSIA